jgi:exopolysaccharide production protein ExoZ
MRAFMRKFHHIQVLRAIAASLVILDHALGSLIKYGGMAAGHAPLFRHLGGIGVAVFFVISGFIMMHTSYDDIGSPQAAGTFIRRRIIRIVPTYWLATFAAFAFFLATAVHVPLANLLRSLLFIPYWSERDAMMAPVLGQGWTLNYEMFFYALFAVSMLMPRRFAMAFMGVVFIGLAAFGSLTGVAGAGDRPTTVLGFLSFHIILLFLLGMALAVARREWPALLRIAHPLTAVALLIGLDLLLFAIVEAQTGSPSSDWISYPIYTAVVAVCIFAADEMKGWLLRLGEALGDASYSTYLFHTFVLAIMNRVLNPHHPAVAIAYVALALVGGNALGYLVFRYFERPATARLRDGSNASRTVAAARSSRSRGDRA